MELDVRWKQRFANLEKAYYHLEEACDRFKLEELCLDWLLVAGVIQTFEFTLELSWKTLKDYMSAKGQEVRFPRDVIKTAFQTGLIHDGRLWLEMLDMRNELSHVYSEEQAQKAMKSITKIYLTAFRELYAKLKTQL